VTHQGLLNIPEPENGQLLGYSLNIFWLPGKLSPVLEFSFVELESSNPQRISKKIGGTDIEAKALFLLLVEGIYENFQSGKVFRKLVRI
jgi:hypothetical protein